MKSLPLAMFARNWMRPMNPAQGLLIGAMVAVMCSANLVAAAADADIPCKQWAFNGYTQFDYQDGGKLTFISFDPYIDRDRKTDSFSIPPDGGGVLYGVMWGGVREGNIIQMTRMVGVRPGPEWPQWFQGGVTDDGFAYGIAFGARDETYNRSSPWRSAAPLRCL